MWIPVTEKKVAVAIWTYHKTKDTDLSLKIGDTVHINEHAEGWYCGYVSTNKAVTGIFPASYVHIKEETRNKGESHLAIESLIDELDIVLKEWVIVMKERFQRNNMVWFVQLRKVLMELIDLRRQLMSGQLPQEPARELRIQITNGMDWGNQRLDLDLIPSIDGNIVETDNCSIVDLHQVHLKSVEQTTKTGQAPVKTIESSMGLAHHIHLQLKNFGCSIGEEAEAFFALYDAKANKFISERYLAKFNKLGVPNNIDKIGNLCTIFSDLSNIDMTYDLYLTCHIIRIGSMLSTGKKVVSNFRRPYGCGVVSLESLLNEPIDELSSTSQETVMKILVQTQNSEAEFSQLHENIIRKGKVGSSSTTNIGISLSLRKLNGHFDQLKREMPLLFTKAATITRKLGFSDIIMPGDVRNDLYVMLDRAELERGRKTAGKNVEVTVHVIDRSNKKMRCIWLGGDECEVDEYRSVIYYHNNQPRWNENIRLSIPMEAFRDTHIRLECRHCSTGKGERSLFAMSFMRLMKEDGTTVEDGEHELFVYKCGENQEFKDQSYLSLPFCTQDMVSRSSPAFGNGTYTRNMKENFIIRTVICSTKLTQNVHLLDLLKWKAHPDKLKHILCGLTRVGGQEIVRVLQDILDALFNILDERASDFERDVFDALVYILGILGDKRFKSFTTVLDTYIKNFFASTQAQRFLVGQLKYYIDHCMTEKPEIVLQTLKAVQNLFKFIFRSHVLYQKATGDLHDGNIQDSMRCLFASMNQMMSQVAENVHLHQLILLNNFSMVATELLVMYSAPEVSQFITELIEHMPIKSLSPEILRAKLQFLAETIKSNLFKGSISRTVLLEPCVRQLRLHIESKENSAMCFDILSSMLESLYKISMSESVDNDISIIVSLLLESVCNMVITLDKWSETMRVCMSCLLELLRLMKDKHYQQLKETLRNTETHRDFLKNIMRVFKELLSTEVYPADWRVMRMLSNSILLDATRRVSVDLSSTFLDAEGPNVRLWFDYFRLACAYITQSSLQYSDIHEAKKERLLSKYGDLRLDMAQEIVSKWQSLGDHKSLFRDLTRPFLEVTMVQQAEIRRLILPIIFDIMCCEKLERGNFNQLEDDLIDKLDTMVCVEKKGDEQFTILFQQVLLECIASQPWRYEGEQFVDKVKRLLERLIDYRNVSDTNVENRHLRLNCMYNLMNFYKDDANREDIYTRYIYRLRDLHLESNHYTEAAFTLLVLAKTLEWRDKMLASDDKHPKQKEMHRKEALYLEIIKLMDKGEMWEFGIPLCKELSVQYESKLFDYSKNSRILQTQATFFDNILKKQRQTPTYFRVSFYGNFPHKSKSWIYRGGPFDKISTLIEQLQADFPRAKGWNRSSRPDSADMLDHDQYIQIRNVEPVVTDNVFKDMNVPIRISSFYDNHNVNTFRFEQPLQKGKKDPENAFKTLWVEETQLTTDNSLPFLLRWVDVISSQTVEIPPIRKAIITMETMNKKIRNMISEMYTYPESNISPLSMILQGTIDAAVMGGPKKYKMAFLSQEYKNEHPDDVELTVTLERLLMEQLKILKDGVGLHERLCPDELSEFQRMLETKLGELRRLFGLPSVTPRVISSPVNPAVANPIAKSRNSTAIFTYRRATMISNSKSPASEEPQPSSTFYLDPITENNAPVSSAQQQQGVMDKRSPQETTGSMRRGRATLATPRELALNIEALPRSKLSKNSDSISSIPSDRSSSASIQSLPSPDGTLHSPRSITPTTEKILKSPHKGLRESELMSHRGPSSLLFRNSAGSRPSSSSSVTSSSSASSREEPISGMEDSNTPPALPERKSSLQHESNVHRTIAVEQSKLLPENGELNPPPPLPTKKVNVSLSGGVLAPSKQRKSSYDIIAAPAIPIKIGRSPSITGNLDGDKLPPFNDVAPPVPTRPSHSDPGPLPPTTAGSPPPPNIPPPELPPAVMSPAVTTSMSAEKLASELSLQAANAKNKTPPPIPIRPRFRLASTHASSETNEH